MIKSELVQRLAEQNPHLFSRDVGKVANAIFGEIEAALTRGDRVGLRGFRAFTVKTWRARPGRNPKTGTALSVPKTRHPSFRTSRQMHNRLNPIAAGPERRSDP